MLRCTIRKRKRPLYAGGRHQNTEAFVCLSIVFTLFKLWLSMLEGNLVPFSFFLSLRFSPARFFLLLVVGKEKMMPQLNRALQSVVGTIFFRHPSTWCWCQLATIRAVCAFVQFEQWKNLLHHFVSFHWCPFSLAQRRTMPIVFKCDIGVGIGRVARF